MNNYKTILPKLKEYQNIQIALDLEHNIESDEEANEYFELSNYVSRIYKENDSKARVEHLRTWNDRKKAIYDKYHPSEEAVKEKDQYLKDIKVPNNKIENKFNSQYLNSYIQKISTFQANQDAQQYISNIQYMKQNDEFREILDLQKLVLNIINNEDGRLWYDTRIKKYCFRSEYGGKIIEAEKKEITIILNKALQKNLPKYHNFDKESFNHTIEVVLVETIAEINKQKLKDLYKADNVVKVILFTPHIPSINNDVFDLSCKEEIFESDSDLLFKRNRFIPTKYLLKRNAFNSSEIIQNSLLINEETPFIKSFIYQMFGGNKEKSDYILNWLAYYYQKLEKTGTALVLLEDQEVSQNLFFNRIIIEIFGKPYCSNIDDNIKDKSALIQDVAKDKLFLNIGDITDAATEFDDVKLALLIKELLIAPKFTFINEDNEQEEFEIYSQLVISSNNPAPYLKKSLSKCSVFNITDIDTIIDNLELEDETELEDNILKDLDIFSDYLNNYTVNEQLAKQKLVTEERNKLKGKEVVSNINKDDLNSKINDFIQAIKDTNLEYFEKVKGVKDKYNKDVYQQLKNTFEKEDGYFVTNDLYLYFNAINSDFNFKDNIKLLELLKEKDPMFKQQYLKLIILNQDGNIDVLFEKYSSSGLDIGSKNLLKINDYKMPEDFTIPSGWFAEKNDNSFEKHTYNDIESSKKARGIARENGHIK